MVEYAAWDTMWTLAATCNGADSEEVAKGADNSWQLGNTLQMRIQPPPTRVHTQPAGSAAVVSDLILRIYVLCISVRMCRKWLPLSCLGFTVLRISVLRQPLLDPGFRVSSGGEGPGRENPTQLSVLLP